MKAILLILIGCITISISGAVLAECYSCGYNRDDSQASCSPFESSCQCTDPSCDRPWDSDCLGRNVCCEAFGNIGAR